jgi:hypothetical protein
MMGVIVAVLAVTILVVQSVGVQAIQGESIVMSPTSKPYKLDAGQVRSDNFTIINDGTSHYTFKVYAVPYSIKNSRYEADLETKAPNADAYQWVKFEQNRYELNPGEKVIVPYTITVPSDAAPGGHYGVIFAETEVDPNQTAQIGRQKRVGTIIYATVDGDYIQAGREVETIVDAVQIGYPLRGRMTVENTGNADFVMKSTLRINNIFGNNMYNKTTEYVLLPKTTRDIPLTWENGPWLGWYNVQTESEILGKKVSHDKLVFIAPLWFLLVTTLVLLAIFYMIYRHFRR